MQRMTADCTKVSVKKADKIDMLWGQRVEQFRLDCLVRGLTSNTWRGYRDRLTQFYKWIRTKNVDPEKVDRTTVSQFIIEHRGRVSDYTVNCTLRVLRCYYGFQQRENILTAENPMGRLKLLKTEKKIRPILSLAQVEQLLRVPNQKTFTGMRNFTIIQTFVECACRLNELIGLKVSEIDIANHELKVYGKGRKERKISFGNSTAKALHRFWAQYRCKLPGEAFFCKANGDPLTWRVVERIVERCGNRIGLYVRPHMLRRTAASLLTLEGMSSFQLQRLLGHSNVGTTEIYASNFTFESLKQIHRQHSLMDKLRLG